MTSRIMTSAEDIRRFLLAGLATITLKSLASGNHYTYRVMKAESRGVPAFDDAEKWFVSVLTDGDTYVYVGMIDPVRAPNLRLTKASKFSEDAGCVKAFRYFYAYLCAGRVAPKLEVRHEGHCGRCGRELTHPDSIDRGIGPDCWATMGLDSLAA